MGKDFRFEIFSLKEAKRILGAIRDKVLKASLLHRRLVALKLKYEILSKFRVDDVEITNTNYEIRHLERELQELIDEIEGHGVRIRDISGGVVEFPTIYRGHPAYFLWSINDVTISYWSPANDREKVFPIEEEDLID